MIGRRRHTSLAVLGRDGMVGSLAAVRFSRIMVCIDPHLGACLLVV